MAVGSAGKNVSQFEALPEETRKAYEDPRPKFIEGEKLIDKTLEVSIVYDYTVLLHQYPLHIVSIAGPEVGGGRDRGGPYGRCAPHVVLPGIRCQRYEVVYLSILLVLLKSDNIVVEFVHEHRMFSMASSDTCDYVLMRGVEGTVHVPKPDAVKQAHSKAY